MVFSKGFYKTTHKLSKTSLSLKRWTACLEILFENVVENAFVQQLLREQSWTDLESLSERLEEAAVLLDPTNKNNYVTWAAITRQVWDMGFKFSTYNKGEEWNIF